MHFETDANEFIEVKVKPKGIISYGEEQGDEMKHAMEMPFVAILPASYILPRLAIQEADLRPSLMFHRHDGTVRHLGIKEIKVDREFYSYRMTISFSPLDTEGQAETFVCPLIQVTKMTPMEKGMMEVEFTAKLHPFKEEDIGRLSKKGTEIGQKQCFLQFEERQKDLANAA